MTQVKSQETEIVQLINTPLLCPIINGQPYVVVKSIVEGIGLNYQNSMKNLADSRLNEFKIEYKLTEAFGGLNVGKTYFALPVRRIAAWLYSINANKVNEDAREILFKFQEQCDEVLFKHFFGSPELEHPFFKEKTRLTLELTQLEGDALRLKQEFYASPEGQALAELERKARRVRKQLRSNEKEQTKAIHTMYNHQKAIE